jgi:hypothetical protein
MQRYKNSDAELNNFMSCSEKLKTQDDVILLVMTPCLQYFPQKKVASACKSVRSHSRQNPKSHKQDHFPITFKSACCHFDSDRTPETKELCLVFLTAQLLRIDDRTRIGNPIFTAQEFFSLTPYARQIFSFLSPVYSVIFI